MRALGSRVTAATCLLLASGCWYRLGVGHGSLVLSWSFNGGENCATTGVTQLEVSGAGLTTTLDCADADGNDFANGTLPKVPAGTQTFLLTGIGPVYDPAAGVTQPKAIYRGTVTFDISEDSVNTPAPVDLIPLEPGAQGGDLLLLWTFGGQSCETAGVSQVGIVQSGTALLSDTGFTDTDRGADLLVPCRANGQQGARILGLPRNLYSLPLYANDDRLPTTFDPYVAAPTAYVTGSTETVLHVDLHAASS